MTILPALLFSALRWLFWHLTRIAGVLLCLAALALSGMAYVDTRNFQTTALFALLAVAALALAFFADGRLSALRKKLEQQPEETGANSANDELVIGVQWFTWFAVLTAAVLFGCFYVFTFFFASWNTLVGKQGWGNVLFWGSIVVLVGSVLTIMLLARLASRALSAGYALKLGSGGLRHCLGFDVAWQDVRGIDLRVFRGRGDEWNYLVLALNAAGVASLHAARRPGLWDWLFIRFVASKDQLLISCPLINMSPSALRDAARRFAQQSNASFDPEWRLPSMAWGFGER